MYCFVNIEEKVKDQDFGSTGVKYIKMLQFCWQWSQNARLVFVNTSQIQHSLLYAACFVTMVIDWGNPCPLAFRGDDHVYCVTIVTYNEASHIWQTILILNRFYLMKTLRQLSAKLEHFYVFDHVEPKSWPLTFSSITTKHYVVNRSSYTFFLNQYDKRNMSVWFLTTLK